jgi:hypothetical protein
MILLRNYCLGLENRRMFMDIHDAARSLGKSLRNHAWFHEVVVPEGTGEDIIIIYAERRDREFDLKQWQGYPVGLIVLGQ